MMIDQTLSNKPAKLIHILLIEFKIPFFFKIMAETNCFKYNDFIVIYIYFPYQTIFSLFRQAVPSPVQHVHLQRVHQLLCPALREPALSRGIHYTSSYQPKISIYLSMYLSICLDMYLSISNTENVIVSYKEISFYLSVRVATAGRQFTVYRGNRDFFC